MRRLNLRSESVNFTGVMQDELDQAESQALCELKKMVLRKFLDEEPNELQLSRCIAYRYGNTDKQKLFFENISLGIITSEVTPNLEASYLFDGELKFTPTKIDEE